MAGMVTGSVISLPSLFGNPKGYRTRGPSRSQGWRFPAAPCPCEVTLTEDTGGIPRDCPLQTPRGEDSGGGSPSRCAVPAPRPGAPAWPWEPRGRCRRRRGQVGLPAPVSRDRGLLLCRRWPAPHATPPEPWPGALRPGSQQRHPRMRRAVPLLFDRFHGYAAGPRGVPGQENEAQEPPAPLLPARYGPGPLRLDWEPGLWHWSGLGWKRVRGPEREAESPGGDPCGTRSRWLPKMGSLLFQLLDSVPQNF